MGTPHALVDDGLASIIGLVPHTRLPEAVMEVTNTLLGQAPIGPAQIIHL